MSKRLFETAEEIQNKQNVRNMLNIYSKVEKQSELIVRKVSQKRPQSSYQKQISIQQPPKLSKKMNQLPIPTVPKSKISVQQDNARKNIKNRIGGLKTQIINEQKSIHKAKQQTTSKQQTEYLIFRLKLLTKRITNTEVAIQRQFLKQAFGKLKDDWERVRQLEAKFVLKRYKKILRKYFDQFYKQTIILKLERQKFQQKLWIQKQQRNQKAAQDYSQFILYRKAISAWKQYHKKQIAGKQKQIVEQNLLKQNELRGKLQDFLSKIKQDMNPPQEVEQEIGYNTIKQQLQESMQSNLQDWSNQQNVQSQNAVNQNKQIANTQKIQKKMTNDQLTKKRQELQLKNKQRKQALEKIKKQKQQLKLKFQQEKRLEEEKLKMQQRRKQREQHEKFIQKRKQQQQRRRKQENDRKRMDDLQILAEKHNKLRILKFKGIVPWKKLIYQRNQNLLKMIKSIQKLNLSVYWRWFKQQYRNIHDKHQQQEQRKLFVAQQFYENKMKRKVISLIQYYNNTAAKQQAIFLKQFREQHCLKQALSIWKTSLPQLKSQNYQIQAEQNKTIQKFRYQFLIKAGFDAFYRNKQQEQKQRRILQHKTKLKQKMQQLKAAKPSINIDDLL